MDEQFSDELTSPVITPKPKSNSTTILLFITIFLLVISIAVIIFLLIKLNNKSKKYDKLKEKYTKQNDNLNNIFEVLLNLISKSDISNTNISEDKYKDVKNTVNSIKDLNDGTYDLEKKLNLILQMDIKYVLKLIKEIQNFMRMKNIIKLFINFLV